MFPYVDVLPSLAFPRPRPKFLLSEPGYISSSDFEGWIKEFIRAEKEGIRIPQGVSVMTVYRVLQGILEYEFITTMLSEEREMQDITNVEGLDPENSKLFPELSDSILNRTLLLDETNDHRISNKRPSTYLYELVDDGVVDDEPELTEIMADHFISPAAIDCMLEDDFDGFIRERQRTLMRHISTLVGAEAPETVA